jgi:hypothetical protein
MLTHAFSLVLTCVAFSACGGVSPGPSNPPMPQASPFPDIPQPTEFDTTPERSDKRRLMVGGDCPRHCRPGPMASIHPRISAASWSAERRDSGVVIARMISDSAYPKFNLQYRGPGRADTVFWAVIRRGDSVISVFRSTTPRTRDLITTTEVIHHDRDFFHGASYARWVWSDTDDMAWGTCDGGACCKSPGRL